MEHSNNIPINNAVNSFLFDTKAKTTKTVQEIMLRCFCKFTFKKDNLFSVDWSKITKEKVLRFIAHKSETVQFSTANNYISVIKIFTEECFSSGVIDAITYNAIKSIRKFRGTAPDNSRTLSIKEVNKVKGYFSKCRSAMQIRNYAIFALCIGCGLRRAEVSTLNIESLKGRRLHIVGKGNKARVAYLSNFSLSAVKLWLSQLPRKTGAMFVHITKSDKIKINRLGVKGIHYTIRSIREACSLTRFTTHDLRHTFATMLLRYGVDIFIVQYLLGHSDPRTTVKYDKRHENEKIKAVELLPF